MSESIAELRKLAQWPEDYGPASINDIAERAAAALEAAREDAFRLDEIKRSRLAVTPVEGGGWDVTVFDADDYKETLLGSGADMRAAIDEAIDQARGKAGQEVGK